MYVFAQDNDFEGDDGGEGVNDLEDVGSNGTDQEGGGECTFS